MAKRLKKIPSPQNIVKYLPQAIRKGLPADIGIAEVSEKESRRLNLIYRDKNKSANVLSFFYSKEYGEIIVCPAVMRREAKEQKHSYEYQFAWMIVHGMIHLSGLHHEKSGAVATRVLTLEKAVLSKIYQEDDSELGIRK